jgi:hypothetical protein
MQSKSEYCTQFLHDMNIHKHDKISTTVDSHMKSMQYIKTLKIVIF